MVPASKKDAEPRLCAIEQAQEGQSKRLADLEQLFQLELKSPSFRLD